MGSSESHFNVLLNCEGQNHKRVSTDHNFSGEMRAEAESNRGPSAYQTLLLGQTGSHLLYWFWTVLAWRAVKGIGIDCMGPGMERWITRSMTSSTNKWRKRRAHYFFHCTITSCFWTRKMKSNIDLDLIANSLYINNHWVHYQSNRTSPRRWWRLPFRSEQGIRSHHL